jgi:hypothetical protein
VVVALAQSAATAVSAATPPNSNRNGGIGIRLLDAPVSRRDDPRAHVYIIDFLAPGTIISRHVEVSNTTTVPQSIQVYAAAADLRNATFAFADGSTPNELTRWISLDRTALTLPPRGRADVAVTIRVPAAASSGERYAVIWAQAVAPPTGSANIGSINRVGVRIYLDIGPGGEPPSDFRIVSITPGRTPHGEPEVFARVRNTGGRAVDLSGWLTLSNGPGSLSAGPFAVAGGTTLAPGEVARATVVLDRRLPNGPWHAHLVLASGLLQRTADADITFPTIGIGRPVVPASVSAGSPPGPLMMILLSIAGAGACVVGVVAVLRRRRRST